MSSIVTDELLCKYIVDSGTLTPQQLEVVRSYLCTNADEADMVAGISMSLYESDVEDNTDSLNHACAIVPFSDEEIEHLYKQLNFDKPFTTLRATHVSNMFALLSTIFKNNTNEKTHTILGMYLVDFFLPSLVLFAKFLRYNAKTPYYQAMGEFIMDFIKTLKTNLGLKIDIK
jgi:hypothetical protein